jgi:hypothetical protein
MPMHPLVGLTAELSVPWWWDGSRKAAQAEH